MRLQNSLTLAIRREITKYYTAPLQCDEPSCREMASGLSTHMARDEAGLPLFPACTVPRCKGRMCKSVTDKSLHTQLLSFKCLFDVKWAHEKLEQDNKRRSEKITPSGLSHEERGAFDELAAQADRALMASAYNTVDFNALFARTAGPTSSSA